MAPCAKFWDKIARKYSTQPVADEAAYQKKLETTQGYFRTDMNIFEFGCGTGSTAIAHAPKIKHIRAIDISSRMIDIARTKAEKKGIKNITFEVNTIEAIELSDESFDMVLGMSILHLLEDKDAAIAKVHRLLRPGGLFVSSTACLRDMSIFIRLILPVGRAIGKFPFVDVFSKEDLLQALRDAGFQIENDWQPGKGKAVFVVARKLE